MNKLFTAFANLTSRTTEGLSVSTLTSVLSAHSQDEAVGILWNRAINEEPNCAIQMVRAHEWPDDLERYVYEFLKVKLEPETAVTVDPVEPAYPPQTRSLRKLFALIYAAIEEESDFDKMNGFRKALAHAKAELETLEAMPAPVRQPEPADGEPPHVMADGEPIYSAAIDVIFHKYEQELDRRERLGLYMEKKGVPGERDHLLRARGQLLAMRWQLAGSVKAPVSDPLQIERTGCWRVGFLRLWGTADQYVEVIPNQCFYTPEQAERFAADHNQKHPPKWEEAARALHEEMIYKLAKPLEEGKANDRADDHGEEQPVSGDHGSRTDPEHASMGADPGSIAAP